MTKSLNRQWVCFVAILIVSFAAQCFGNDSNTEVVTCTVVGAGTVRILVHKDWAPIGAERFLQLVDLGFYDGTALFRVIPNFLVQFGMSKNRKLQEEWGRKNIKDDPKIGIPVTRGTLAYAGSGQDSRSTQIWIAYQESHGLGDQPWETPFAQVIDGMQIVQGLYSGYGDGPPYGNGPSQGEIWEKGYQYISENFPAMDYIGTCKRSQTMSSSNAAAPTPPEIKPAEVATRTTDKPNRQTKPEVTPKRTEPKVTPQRTEVPASGDPSFLGIIIFSGTFLLFIAFLAMFASRVMGSSRSVKMS